MPSQPDPNSPNMDTRLQAMMGIRAPGTPTSAGKPGVQAAGVQFPAPPVPAVGFPGRPTTPQAATPTAVVPTAGKTTAPPKQAKPQDRTHGSVQPGAAEAIQPVAPAPLLTPGQDGSLAITPEGDVAYRNAVLAGRDRMGPIPKLFRHATLPELPFELGTHNYNPFTGTWVTPEPGGDGAQ